MNRIGHSWTKLSGEDSGLQGAKLALILVFAAMLLVSSISQTSIRAEEEGSQEPIVPLEAARIWTDKEDYAPAML